ncbi:hypothetical protein TB2_040077 [Malus domestica]
MFRAHCSHTQTHLNFSYHSPLKTQIPKIPKRFVVFANNGNALEHISNSKERVEEKGKDEGTGSDGGVSDDELVKNQRPLFGNIRWGDLLPDPDPNNVLAVGLTRLLTWASVHVLSIALAILVAAGKYSFIATVLLIILITLLWLTLLPKTN